MTMDEYQRGALRTAAYPSTVRVLYPALKLAGEAGEVAEKLGKLMRDEGLDPAAGMGERLSDAQRRALGAELGDVLWYVAVLAHDLGLSLDAIAARNLDKLADRAERGVLGGSGDDR